MDTRDWFVMLLVAGAWIAGTVFLFLHASAPVFATWGSICATMTGFYHWIVIRDSKVPDACAPKQHTP